MTREEAINHLEDLHVFRHEQTETDREALGMAIEALSQPEIPKGRWECVKPGWYECSCCGRDIQSYMGRNTAKYYPYCHCGAEMRDVVYSKKNIYHSICESLEKGGSADMRGNEND